MIADSATSPFDFSKGSSNQQEWSVNDSNELYGLENWGALTEVGGGGRTGPGGGCRGGGGTRLLEAETSEEITPAAARVNEHLGSRLIYGPSRRRPRRACGHVGVGVSAHGVAQALQVA